MKWSCFLEQACGLAKVNLVCVHTAFRISTWVKYAVSGLRISRVHGVVKLDPVIDDAFCLEAVCDFMEIDGPLFERPPQSFNEDVV